MERREEVELIARGWIESTNSTVNGSGIDNKLLNYERELIHLLDEDIHLAWDVILKIVSIIAEEDGHARSHSASSETLATLGAGSFEELLHENWEWLISKIEGLSCHSPYFRRMVQASWRGQIPEKEWSRIEAITEK